MEPLGEELCSDQPSERDKLEVKCLRLENQVKTLKEVSSIRKTLLELRERESKDLIQRLKSCEEIVVLEKCSRQKVGNTLKQTELQNQQLEQKLAKTVTALNDSGQKVESLHSQIILQTESLQNVIKTKETLQKELTNKLEHHHTQFQQMDSEFKKIENIRQTELQKFKDLETVSTLVNKELKEKLETTLKENDSLKIRLQQSEITCAETVDGGSDYLTLFLQQQEELKIALEKNQNFSYQMTLLSDILNKSDENSIDLEKMKEIGEIVRGSNSENHFLSMGNPKGTKIKTTDYALCSANKQVETDLNAIMKNIEESEHIVYDQIPGEESCYKSVETTTGTRLVLSVSKTFIKLKDLILEKKSLAKEIHSLKQINKKLEAKVDSNSRRLCAVTLELNKTWSLVAKLKAQHGQLHTSKSVLRYELKENRRILEKLKRDLYLSRDKWIRVRQKNSESQLEWESIRDEFARRRAEVCQSRESAFFEESSSSTSNDIYDGEKESEQVLKREKNEHLNENNDNGKHTVGFGIVDELVVELADEIDTIKTEVDKTENNDIFIVPDAESINTSNLTYEAVQLINRRAHRFLELEEQCGFLYNKLKGRTIRTIELSSKLANLHNQYGCENSTEEFATEDEEIGLQISETSDDTANASRDIQQFANREGDETEVYSENGDDYQYQYAENEIFLHSTDAVNPCISTPQNDDVTLEPSSKTDYNLIPKFINSNTQMNPSNICVTYASGGRKFERRASEPMPNRLNEVSQDCKSKTENSNYKRGIKNTEGNWLRKLKQTIDGVVGVGDDEEDAMTSIPHQPYSIKFPQSSSSFPNVSATGEGISSFFTTEHDEDHNEDEKGSSANPSDLTTLSRLIVHQLPKILEVLQKENINLKNQVTETGLVMRTTQVALDEQKQILHLLQPQIEASVKTEMELRKELDLKQRLIQELTSKIQIASENYETINKDHIQMSEYFRIKMQEEKVQEQRKLVKMRNIKNCTKCTKKFTLFKRKVHCSICGHSFCAECLVAQINTSLLVKTTQKRILSCNSCNERKRKLDAVIEQNIDVIEI